jgi:hypothetical protein
VDDDVVDAWHLVEPGFFKIPHTLSVALTLLGYLGKILRA